MTVDELEIQLGEMIRRAEAAEAELRKVRAALQQSDKELQACRVERAQALLDAEAARADAEGARREVKDLQESQGWRTGNTLTGIAEGIGGTIAADIARSPYLAGLVAKAGLGMTLTATCVFSLEVLPPAKLPHSRKHRRGVLIDLLHEAERQGCLPVLCIIQEEGEDPQGRTVSILQVQPVGSRGPGEPAAQEVPPPEGT